MAKRTLEAFFSPPSKKAKADIGPLSRIVSPLVKAAQATDTFTDQSTSDIQRFTSHPSWPSLIADLPKGISDSIEELLLTASGKAINNQPHLDLLYFQPLIPQPTADELFRFLRSSLPFYRVKYTINRFGKSLDINTPRYTTVFGIDETSRFLITQESSSSDESSSNITYTTSRIVESSNLTKESPPAKYQKYTVPPRPIPPCLMLLKNLMEALASDTYNIVLVNYYATGTDSISFHSDDERFLGENPAIASFSLGARRDFLLKHKPPGAGPGNGNKNGAPKGQDAVFPGTTQIKLPLGSGDMILMRGETQRNWLHSIPKRTGKGNEADTGRINITMRKAMIPAGTANYYQYNVGTGPVYRWDNKKKEMRLWEEMKLEENI
ncbi:hypothetical protein H2198_004621 [Neophaeococcomyces mojaviensis]|uniref:Uncharacterized protein n=1 Tax=Neophaeococcomyces mojaviensis TaxID=3383035 RepID=A0ACC3A841_9EURO|nr:hypothetical protein H2198_004621 [Knufia sp. JES_112]